MEIKLHSRGRPLVGALVRVQSKNGAVSEMRTDRQGTVHSAAGDSLRLTVSRPGYQREVRAITADDRHAISVEMQAVNAWYGLQRLLEAVAEALALIPVAAAAAPSVRRIAKVAGSMARQQAPLRHAATLAILLLLWATHEYPVSPWSTAYHNWLDNRGFRVPSPFDGRQTLRPRYPSGRTKVLGPGEVIVGDTVVVERGASLTIQPDTILRFAESAGIQVHGEIRAEGTPEQPILLEPHAPLGIPVRWSGIYVGAEPTGEENSERVGAAAFRYCHFQHAGGFKYEKWDTKRGTRPKIVSSLGLDRTRGGAVFAYKPAQCVISHCVFNQCQAAWGGALYLRETKGAVIESAVFENNSAKDPGQNERDLGGGAICLWASSPSFVDCAFRSNAVHSPEGKGGAMYVAQQSILTLRNCEFRDNRADESGGAIFANDTLKEQDEGQMLLTTAMERELIEQCVFERNVSKQGGAIAFKKRVSPYILQCIFVDNVPRNGREVPDEPRHGSAVYIAPEYPKNPDVERDLCEGLRFERNVFRHTGNGGSGGDVVFRLGSGSRKHQHKTLCCGDGPQRQVNVQVEVYRDTIDGEQFWKKLDHNNPALRPMRIATRPLAKEPSAPKSIAAKPAARPWAE
jgi:predicted outer membrane repeat protein